MKRFLPLVFALLKFGSCYFLINPAYDFQRDEYLYLNQGLHPAWGYLEVPPLIAAQGWLSMALGGGFLWVKFWPFLWGAATVYLVMRLAQRLGGGWFATALAGSCYLGTAFTRLNLLFQPNSFEVFGFMFCLYWLVCYFQQQRARYFYLVGLGLGLGLLNKYTTLFFIAALVGALLLTPWRRLLLSRHFWGAGAVAGLLWLPNALWQLRHGIPFLHHMQLLHDSQLVHVEAANFWKAQLVFCLAAVWVWLPGLLALLLSAAFRPYRAVAWVAVLGVGLLAALHGKDYYALGYYPVLFAFGAVWWEARLRASRWKMALQPALVAVPLLFLLAFLPLLFPVYGPAAMAGFRARYAALSVYHWEDGRDHALPQDYADMLGWHELADKVWAAYRSLPDSVRAHTLIHCDNYGEASAINYYNRGRGLPPANSLNGSFIYWYPAWQQFQALIIIDGEPDDEALIPHFATYRRFGCIAHPYARERGTAITIGRRPDSGVQARVEQERHRALAEWEGPEQPGGKNVE